MSVAIVGVGTVGFLRTADEGLVPMVHRALGAALDDCGLRRECLDGVLVHIGSPRGLDYDTIASLLAVKLVADGRISPKVARVLPLEEIVRAHQLVESGRQIGRIVVTPESSAPRG